MSSDRAEFVQQIEGHMRMVEKHLSGVTFGLGADGRLWLLDAEPGVALDSYRGPYVQVDEEAVSTYENQRWNAIAGVLSAVGGLKEGYTPIRKCSVRRLGLMHLSADSACYRIP